MLINGSPNEKGCTYTALNEVSRILEYYGIETKMVWIDEKPIAGCASCGWCQKSGKCKIDDIVNVIHEELDQYNGIVIGSPVYYAGITGQLKCLLDRLYQSADGEFEGKIGAAVVSCRRGGASSAFDCINKFFTISNMSVVGSQYWNQVHGCIPEEVLKDKEGMQTMRSLGQNIVWNLKNMEAGLQQGVKLPAYEDRIWTDFIGD